MKKFFSFLVTALFAAPTFAQDFAMDFEQDDCNGNPTHLFAELDQNKAIIIEFFMTNCNPCINAGNAINGIYDDLQSMYPGQIDWYHFGFNDSYPCQEVMGWVEDHGYPSKPFIDGATQVAYYGGFGMPTIVVVAGPNHEVIYSTVGWSSGDQNDIQDAIVEFFGPSAVAETTSGLIAMNAFFNNASSTISIQFDTDVDATLQLLSLTGQEVLAAKSFSGKKAELNAAEISNGIYIVQATVNGEVAIQRIQINR